MVQHTDTNVDTHTHMGEARVLAHTCMGQPVLIWAAHTRTGSPYGLPIRIWDSPYVYGQNTCMGRNIATSISRKNEEIQW